MDLPKVHFENRSGTRKPWDDLSEDRKRKIRKVYFDKLNPGENCNISSVSNSDSNSEQLLTSISENSNYNNGNIINNQLDIPNANEIIPQINCDNININSVSTSIDNIINLKDKLIEENVKDNLIEEINKPEIVNNLKSNESIPVNNFTENQSFAEKLKSNLAKSIIDHKINQIQSNAILSVLRDHPLLQFLPKDSRSLLKTPREKIDIKQIAPGEYLHLSLSKMLRSILDRLHLESIPSELLIDFSTDGAELNSETQLWPIQFRVVNLEFSKPELVGIYKGPSKPSCFKDFFSDFVKEVNLIDKEGGIKYNGTIIPIKLRCFIADAPARAYVLNHYGHNSEYPCSKCEVKGITYLNSKRFPGINYKQRTNDEYRSQKDVDHHKGESALHDLSIDLVHHVSFDYMHLVCLGVMKKTMESLVFGTCLPKKLETFKLKILNNRFVTLQLYCPREFARNPRELDHISKFKATEFRQLLLYTFIVVFRGVISDDQYDHFLLLNSSMRVLLNKSSTSDDIDFAESSLKNFVIKSESIHGLKFLTYNAHGLLHLVSDYKLYGHLDSVSSFPYENCMPRYRDFVKKPDKPLQQIYNRIQEQFKFPKTSENDIVNFKASKIHNCGPVPSAIKNTSIQYESLQTPTFFFSLENTDNTIITNDNRIGIIKNIIAYNNEYYFAVHFFENLQPFYMISTQPSTKFGIFVCTCINDSRAVIITYNEIKSKCYRMPMWVNKPLLNKNVNDEQLNNAFVTVVL